MPASVPDVLPYVDAVEAALTGAGLIVYVGGTPAASGWVPPDKFAVLYPDPGTAVSESLADERTDLTALIQVTCVGGSVDRALWVAWKVRQALTTPLVVEGRASWRPEDRGGPPVQRDDDVTPPLWFVPVQYRLMSTLE